MVYSVIDNDVSSRLIAGNVEYRQHRRGLSYILLSPNNYMPRVLSNEQIQIHMSLNEYGRYFEVI